ncbi:hypothetical protein ACJX0J_026719, partial [Zea mays]
KAKAYSDSKSPAYLTAEQALADFAVLLTDLKRNLSEEGSPVVLFGGSYGGNSWKELDDQANKQDGLLKLSKTFHLCQTLKTSGDLSDWLSSAYSYLAMVDYPLPSEFLRPLPANPIKEACTEMVMPMSYSEQRSMYPPYKFDCASYDEDCIKSYGVKPRPKWVTTEFGGH